MTSSSFHNFYPLILTSAENHKIVDESDYPSSTRGAIFRY